MATVAASAVLISGASWTETRAQAGTGAATSGGIWGAAEEVPGVAALNQGGNAEIVSISCGSAGNCSGGGYYKDASGTDQAFVVTEINGTWGSAEQVPGMATLAPNGNAEVSSVSCARAGDCDAAGDYTDDAGLGQVFVVSEKKGIWQPAQEVPGIAALNQRGQAGINSVSCTSAGNCSAGGNYEDGSGHTQVFVVSEVKGTWGSAEEVPGSAALNRGGTAEIISVACGAAGNCGAGGLYEDSSGKQHAFVVSEADGAWGNAEEVPGTAQVYSVATSVSCPSPGNCDAAGYYGDNGGLEQAFVAAETNGTWGPAEEIPIPDLGQRGLASVTVSCGSEANCSASGDFRDDADNQQAFAGIGKKGVWGTAEEIPGSAALNQGGEAEIHSLSCRPAGNCSAGGMYADNSGALQALVASETNSTWGTAEEVPGSAALNQGGNAVTLSVSCASAGNCSAGGYYTDSSGHLQAFVVNETGA
jgi:cytochrome c551/c552